MHYTLLSYSLNLAVKSHTVGKLSCYTTVYCESAMSICTAQNCDYFSLLQGGSESEFHKQGGTVTEMSHID